MAGDERLREFSKIKAERDKGRWTDEEYRQLMAAIREGVEPYRSVRAELTGKPAPTAKDNSQRWWLSLPLISQRAIITTAVVVGVLAIVLAFLPEHVSLLLLIVGVPTGLVAWILSLWMRPRFAIGSGFFIVVFTMAIVGAVFNPSELPTVVAQPSAPPSPITNPPPSPSPEAVLPQVLTRPAVAAPPPKPWYSDGTLHRATGAQWRAASHRDKLATAADWLAGTTWKNHLNSPSDFDRLKIRAERLVEAVDIALSGGNASNTAVAEIAAPIMLIANDLGP